MEKFPIDEKIVSFLESSGLKVDNYELSPMEGGGNNRLYLVNGNDYKKVVKCYFGDGSDKRDRIGAEYRFLEFAWDIGIDCIPKPLRVDLNNRMALYDFVEGEKINNKSLNDSHIIQAAHFIKQLNSWDRKSILVNLPLASEACFTILEHFAVLDYRLELLEQIRGDNEIDERAIEFRRELIAVWAEKKNHIIKECKINGFDLNEELQEENKIVSPSDFGFHNAIMRRDGKLVFIDFEYAGWDDPAKTASDFFSHPANKVPREYFNLFMENAFNGLDKSEEIINRTRILEPIFQLKWCCIIMNEFLSMGLRRRIFAQPNGNQDIIKQRQLYKARHLLNTIKLEN